ncbi:hypothetical protein [Photorhabdus caribbeanensis]|uniref:hypothetical protein n=1 Tax=Photorhabdus caribbeanensis TaxID=1004165 RepID=UPI001BD641DA|nr:hypothetical protein [Photorhabdus caribbeanensis]
MAYEIGSCARQSRGTAIMLNCRFACVELQDVQLSLIAALYTQWISRCIATAREQIPGSIDNYVAGVSAANKETT